MRAQHLYSKVYFVTQPLSVLQENAPHYSGLFTITGILMVGIHGSQSSEGADTLLRMEPKTSRAIYTPKAGEEGVDCRWSRVISKILQTMHKEQHEGFCVSNPVQDITCAFKSQCT